MSSPQTENNFNCLIWLFSDFSKSPHVKQYGKKIIKIGYYPFYKHKIETVQTQNRNTVYYK